MGVSASGVLRRKYPAPQFKRNDEELIQWLKERDMYDYVQTEEKVDWRSLKRTISTKGDMVVTEDGEIVEGVTVVERPPTFEVEVEE